VHPPIALNEVAHAKGVEKVRPRAHSANSGMLVGYFVELEVEGIELQRTRSTEGRGEDKGYPDSYNLSI
jgi:hypothetical protein